MKLALCRCLFVWLALIASTGAAYAQGRGQNLAARLLAAHNRERALVGAPPLRWDTALAAAAATYGPALAARGGLVHSPRQNRPGQSENLWMGSRGAYSPEQMVGGWAAEKAYFRPGIFPNVSSTRNWAHVGHYTQMIWRGTTHVGCALQQSRRYDFLICRYSPRGNIDGQRVP
jgi:Cysteine-rich secretory protein family